MLKSGNELFHPTFLLTDIIYWVFAALKLIFIKSAPRANTKKSASDIE